VDTVVREVVDSAVLEALFECDSTGRVVLHELAETKGELARQQARFEEGRLKVETRWKTRYIDRLVEIKDTVTVVELRETIREVKYIPKFFWACFAVALCAAGWVAWRIVRGLRQL
jgi:hypothetical protein